MCIKYIFYVFIILQPVNPRATMMNTETPKFPKPDLKIKKSLQIQSE